MRCPAVLLKTGAPICHFISASGVTIMALFPLTNNDFPRRQPTACYEFTIQVEPVAEINGTRLSLVIISPTL
jgi:hypothetical protein